MLFEAKWLLQLSHEKFKNNFSASKIAAFGRKSRRKPFTDTKQVYQQRHQSEKKLNVEKITNAVNAVGVAMWTTAEVRDKWQNLQSQAKPEEN